MQKRGEDIMPKVSVVMPSYNHERYISEAIDSVLNQTFTDFELIIIDDASKDKSKEIIKIYKEKDSRIRAFFHSENKGISRTMNECLEKADGKFIAFFASDDAWVKDKLEKQLEVLAKDEDLIVWSEGLIIDAQGDPTGELWTARFESKKKKSGDLFEEILVGNFICGQSRIHKRENISDIRFNEALKYLNDYLFEVELARKYEYYFIPEPLAMYRVHGENTRLDRMGWSKDQIIMGEYFLQKYGDEISNKVKAKIFKIMGKGYSYVGERVKARQYLYQGIKLDLFDRSNLFDLVIALTNMDGAIRNFLRWSYQKISGCKK
jgi:glycosyltransferase involved in cell wall biosynthesis